MPIHESGEDYLEAIYVLGKERGVVRSIDVAHHLKFSKPSVSRARHYDTLYAVFPFGQYGVRRSQHPRHRIDVYLFARRNARDR